MTKLLILNKIDKDVHQIYSLINQLKKGHIDILRKILKNHDIIDFEK